jgi:hypothetical protein
MMELPIMVIRFKAKPLSFILTNLNPLIKATHTNNCDAHRHTNAIQIFASFCGDLNMLYESGSNTNKNKLSPIRK